MTFGRYARRLGARIERHPLYFRWRLLRLRMTGRVKTLPDYGSPLRHIVADAQGGSYVAIRSLAEAAMHKDAAVVFEGKEGHTIYLTIPVRHIQCNEAALRQLLVDLDALDWASPEDTHLCFELAPVGTGISGGMGGGLIVDGLWLHPSLIKLDANLFSQVSAVLTCETARLETDTVRE